MTVLQYRKLHEAELEEPAGSIIKKEKKKDRASVANNVHWKQNK
jgi:hypothetical protein